ncbi:S9 family peptidase [uncultured Planktosalinus sp.]|uniref:S9 family peptidase n=1 Tax=uncultured Planktosalinus sp. TaxID=1810935 RepID=UPI0030DB4AC3
MKQLSILTALLLLFIACGEKEKQPQEKTIGSYTIAQFMDNEAVFGSGFSPDNSNVLVSSNRSGIYNMYTLPSSGGEMTPLTTSDSSSVYSVSYFPNDERILFRMDGNGDEIYKLFVMEEDSITRLTPAENVRALFYGWSKDGSKFYYGSNERDPRFSDVYEMDVENFNSKMVFDNSEGYNFGGVSNNGNYIAFTKSINTNDADLFLYNRNDQSFTKINSTQSGNSAQDFSTDDAYLYYTTDAEGEFEVAMKYDIANKTSEKVLEKDWDIWGVGFSHDGTYRTVFINEDAANVLEITNTKTGEQLDLPEFENAYITGIQFSKDESMALLNVGGSHTPTDLYALDLATGEYTKLTDVLNDAINPDDLVAAEIIRYSSFDGVEIPAVYYKPHNASADNPVPAMVWVHGGPGGQSRQSYSSLIQYLVNHGYAVLAVNNRGSSGYGKTFFKMDDQNHGEADLQDCIEGKNWLAEQADIDANNIGIMGGSYGGYMTMAALTFAPEEFDVGVNIYGVTNWLRTLKSIPPWWEAFKESLYLEMGDPNTKDSIRLHRISPLFHAENVTKPLMVLQGATDPRVLQVESDEIVENVRKNGVPVEYVLFEDEGHGFVKKENQIKAYESILNFLDTYLKESESENEQPTS